MPSCCIYHEFLIAATTDPRRLAVVHASGGLQLFRESRTKLRDASSSSSDPSFNFNLSKSRISSCPPVFLGDECFTYEDLLSAVDSLSWRIRAALDGEDDTHLPRPPDYQHISGGEWDSEADASTSYMPHVVGVQIAPSVEYIVAVLSILRCGEAFLPLDPSWPDERILAIISSSRTRLVIQLKSDSVKGFGGCQVDGGGADWIVDRGGTSVLYFSIKEKFAENVAHATDLVWSCKSDRPRKFCYLMYTSGSTGEPKGVCGTEIGLLNRFWWMQDQFPISQEDVLLFKTAISFVDHLQEFLSAVLARAFLVIPPYTGMKSPEDIADFLKEYSLSRLTTVPSLVRELLPCLDISQCSQPINSLKVLVLSGEVLSISLWRALHDLLPKTTILNLYGSTEVAGDCSYFDCTKLPDILDAEPLSSVPIGKPIANCEIDLIGEQRAHSVGELCVRGICLFVGYIGETSHKQLIKNDYTPLHFKTGDIARRLLSGDFVFIGRNDRTVKVRGQRIALEEIENVLREHHCIRDAAVIFQNASGDHCHLEAFFVTKATDESLEGPVTSVDRHANEELIASIRSWLMRKLPPAMLPTSYVRTEMLPKSFSGKIDYAKLASSTYVAKRLRRKYERNISDNHHLQCIKKAFLAALPVEDVSDDDDFFMMGGNSLSAAHAAYTLGIDMRLLYVFPSPFRLLNALLDQKHNGGLFNSYMVAEKRLRVNDNMFSSFEITREGSLSNTLHGQQLKENTGMMIRNLEKLDTNQSIIQRVKDCVPRDEHIKMASSFHPNPCDNFSLYTDDPWLIKWGLPRMCSFSCCNQIVLGPESVLKPECQACLYLELPRHGSGHMQELWKVFLKSCVDASPLVVLKDGSADLFVGSHSQVFLCVDAFCGSVRWQVILEGRIECSAAITGDFSQVVVGCYKGKIYFLHYTSGSILWTFQTSGEVKMQPLVDEDRGLIWCGSHDHHLYAFDYKRHYCVFKTSCGGSIYGSPAIDKVRNMLYVASTRGLVLGVSLEAMPFVIAWRYESGAPIFGSLCLDSFSGKVFCCSVDGHVIALNPQGQTVWKVSVGGPVFAGACMSSSLPSQLLICSRNGGLYSIDMEDGALLWDYQTGDPITASAYVDEQCCVIAKPSHPCRRLACVCSSSGRIHVLSICPNAKQERAAGVPGNQLVGEFAVMDLPGDIFSSPVMIGGRIFVGGRDDYVHCLTVITPSISGEILA